MTTLRSVLDWVRGTRGEAERDEASPELLAAEIRRCEDRVGRVVRQRIAQVVRTLDPGTQTPDDVTGGIRAMVAALTPMDAANAWLTLAVVEGHLPPAERVVALVREAELDGTAAAVIGTISRVIRTSAFYEPWLPVRVVTNRCLVDVQHTSRTDFATGIQRVTREVTRRWANDHDITLIGWRDDLTAMRALTDAECHRACWGGIPVTVPDDDFIIVPRNCTYILPELAAEVDRAARLQGMAQSTDTTLNMIGYDLVPITTAETSHDGLVPGFARNLAAARYARAIVPISVGAAGEYRGWRSMLRGTGLGGPRIDPVVLPAEAPPEDPAATAAAAAFLLIGTLPLILVVGSHEPRKNHLPLLHAAEMLWREGLGFSLTFIGGNSWNSEEFVEALASLQAAGRPVEAISAATDDLLWGGYRVARFTAFPSLNEGFGLPVAESLACGTPVVTSQFGSMKEIADAGGGALLVDPRNDRSIMDAMRTLLTDEDVYQTLVREARARPRRTWDSYARDTWDKLTGTAI